MEKIRLFFLSAVILLGCCFSCNAQSTPAPSIEIHLTLTSEISDTALSGRVYVMFDRNVYSQPLRSEMPEENNFWFATDVCKVKPGTDIILSGDVLGYPCKLGDLPEGDYAAQAIFDINITERNFSDAPGNIYSDAIAAIIKGGEKSVIEFSLDRVVDKREIHETGFLKEAKIESRFLSDYLGRPTEVKGIVVLPPSYYSNPEQNYATVFVMPGFGSPYTAVLEGTFQLRRYGMNSVGREKVFVFLDQECPLGYHGFANSENNGPWADALIKEYIPYLEKNFRIYKDPAMRFLTGQSSGAWAGLWLQTIYPDQFGGVWACSPDPVDFQAFLGVDIYEPNSNLLFDTAGVAIELNKYFSDVNRVVGDGWVLSTFEAVFSPRGSDGRPLELWNRDTGVIDAAVAAAWKKYDLSLILQNNWSDLADKLAGKIHIYVADNDPFGLDDPVRLLQEAMTGVDNDLEIEIFEAGEHNLWNKDLRQRIHQSMDDLITAKYPGD